MRPASVPSRAIALPQKAGYTIYVTGAERAILRDAYHSFLQIRWSASIGLIALAFLLVNIAFATVYFLVGGVEGMRPGSFFDAFVFSVETLGTIGYGVMHPASPAANAVMVCEAIAGIIFTALTTGLVFAKFSRPIGRIAFSEQAVMGVHDGAPMLMFRVGNLRSNAIIEANLHVVASITQKTKEGGTFFKLHDLALLRDRIGALRRGWLVMHPLDERSPLHGFTAEDLVRHEVELEIAVIGVDDVTMQTVHAMHQYGDRDIVFGRRFADTIQVLDGGDLLFDMSKFHETVPREE